MWNWMKFHAWKTGRKIMTENDINFEFENFCKSKSGDFSEKHTQVDVYSNGVKICTYHWNPFWGEDFKMAKDLKTQLRLKLGALPMGEYLDIWQGKKWGKKLSDSMDKLISDEVWKYYEKHPIEPKTDDILYCIYSDITSYENAQDFEDWACEFGYDTDSRKAEAIYKEIEKEILALGRAGIKEAVMEWGDTHPDY